MFIMKMLKNLGVANSAVLAHECFKWRQWSQKYFPKIQQSPLILFFSIMCRFLHKGGNMVPKNYLNLRRSFLAEKKVDVASAAFMQHVGVVVVTLKWWNQQRPKILPFRRALVQEVLLFPGAEVRNHCNKPCKSLPIKS